MKKLVLVFSLISSTMFAMEDGEKPKKDCCELYTHAEMVNLWLKPLTFLALSCHEFSEEEIRSKAQKILKDDPKAPFHGFIEEDREAKRENAMKMEPYIDLENDTTNLKSPLQLLEIKQNRGCKVSSCELLRRMIITAEQKLNSDSKVQRLQEKSPIEQKYEEIKRNL